MNTLGTSVRRIVEYAKTLSNMTKEWVGVGGQKLTARYMAQLNEWVTAEFGRDCVDQRLCGTRRSFDFFIRPEETVIEVERSLSNRHSNLESDIFKTLIARDQGVQISTLLLLGDHGSATRHSEPASRAAIAWVQKHCGLRVIVHDVELAA